MEPVERVKLLSISTPVGGGGGENLIFNTRKRNLTRSSHDSEPPGLPESRWRISSAFARVAKVFANLALLLRKTAFFNIH